MCLRRRRKEKREDEVKEINHSQEQFPSHVHFPFLSYPFHVGLYFPAFDFNSLCCFCVTHTEFLFRRLIPSFLPFFDFH